MMYKKMQSRTALERCGWIVVVLVLSIIVVIQQVKTSSMVQPSDLPMRWTINTKPEGFSDPLEDPDDIPGYYRPLGGFDVFRGGDLHSVRKRQGQKRFGSPFDILIRSEKLPFDVENFLSEYPAMLRLENYPDKERVLFTDIRAMQLLSAPEGVVYIVDYWMPAKGDETSGSYVTEVHVVQHDGKWVCLVLGARW